MSTLKNKLKFKPKDGNSPICRSCGFYESVHRPRYVKYGGCSEWVPTDNLEFLEWCVEKKGEDK